MARQDYSTGGIGCLAVFFLGLVAVCSGGGSDERSSRGSDPASPPSAIIPASPAPATDTSVLRPPVVADEDSRQYHVGPRGGCYYVGNSGGKVYVDRSECARAGASAAPEPLISPERGSSTPRSALGERQLHVGSRGGCYYIGDSGEKEYVDRSECSRVGTSAAPQPLLSTGSGSSARRSGGGRELHVGPRGGCYYINSNGNKTYVDRSACH